MSVMDKLKQMLKGHESQADKGVDRAGDYADDKTQSKHSGQVDTAQEKMKEQYRSNPDQNRPPQP
ncbi:antitoxin [Streptomyces sp. NPDC051907]|uniref:antitoxin n=1 Tax=Streptomyces sp. NPDC051907 TaxID=3155284 RepID=UPI0034143EE5